jgi:hypothetical protein
LSDTSADRQQKLHPIFEQLQPDGDDQQDVYRSWLE